MECKIFIVKVIGVLVPSLSIFYGAKQFYFLAREVIGPVLDN